MNSQDKRTKDYLEKIKGYPKLSADEEKKLAQKIHDNDDDKMKRQLANANLLLVVQVAEKYKDYTNDVGFSDLIESGNLGLFKAVEIYSKNKRYEKDFKFSTYATWWIRRAIHKRLSIEDDE